MIGFAKKAAGVFSVAIAFTMLSLGASTAWAQQKSLKAQLVGAWSVVSSEVIAKDGAKQLDYGPKPKGVMILDAGGRYAYVVSRPDRPKFKATSNWRRDTPAAEFGEAARAFAANSGTWSVNEADKTLTRKYETALIPNNEGQDLKASVTLVKDELKIVSVAANGSKTEVVLRRAK